MQPLPPPTWGGRPWHAPATGCPTRHRRSQAAPRRSARTEPALAVSCVQRWRKRRGRAEAEGGRRRSGGRGGGRPEARLEAWAWEGGDGSGRGAGAGMAGPGGRGGAGPGRGNSVAPGGGGGTSRAVPPCGEGERRREKRPGACVRASDGRGAGRCGLGATAACSSLLPCAWVTSIADVRSTYVLHAARLGLLAHTSALAACMKHGLRTQDDNICSSRCVKLLFIFHHWHQHTPSLPQRCA